MMSNPYFKIKSSSVVIATELKTYLAQIKTTKKVLIKINSLKENLQPLQIITLKKKKLTITKRPIDEILSSKTLFVLVK